MQVCLFETPSCLTDFVADWFSDSARLVLFILSMLDGWFAELFSGTFRQCASTSNFRLSFENRANSAHQSRHAQSFAVSGASYWKDCHGTNIRNRASDRRAPFCTYDSHKRWDIRSALRRNAQTGTDGEENKQGWVVMTYYFFRNLCISHVYHVFIYLHARADKEVD